MVGRKTRSYRGSASAAWKIPLLFEGCILLASMHQPSPELLAWLSDWTPDVSIKDSIYPALNCSEPLSEPLSWLWGKLFWHSRAWDIRTSRSLKHAQSMHSDIHIISKCICGEDVCVCAALVFINFITALLRLLILVQRHLSPHTSRPCVGALVPSMTSLRCDRRSAAWMELI